MTTFEERAFDAAEARYPRVDAETRDALAWDAGARVGFHAGALWAAAQSGEQPAAEAAPSDPRPQRPAGWQRTCNCSYTARCAGCQEHDASVKAWEGRQIAPGPRQGPTRDECYAAADALEGALHVIDDDESAEHLARLADQWRAQAAETERARA